ncbi:glutathione S-transferase family protein [uncultured Tateyamaria sp.]|uniref:glutathione S-transferase family protein n=1 Tax=uncultured Tateyamaria sp. TaxID=455651 RepID=UPI0026350194|nr:glutathione S-transferase family protein [uncultured Tateyamaria sp.]
MDIGLTGYRYSVYTRTARMALDLAGLSYDYREANPFDHADTLVQAHPMRRVPVLHLGDTTLYETAALLTWCDAHRGWQAPPLVQARAVQVGGIADAYAYWPLVRHVFSHGWFRPAFGADAQAGLVVQGLRDAAPVLDMLETIAAEGLVLTPGTLTRADCHLAPMIDTFQMVPEAADMLAARPNLSAWFAALSETRIFRTTRPHWDALTTKEAP